MSNDRNAPKNEKLLFFRKFLERGKFISSFAPSTRSLATAFCHYISSSTPQVILELGCGTGAATKIVLQKMHKHSKLVAIEADPDFAAFAQQCCPEAQIKIFLSRLILNLCGNLFRQAEFIIVVNFVKIMKNMCNCSIILSRFAGEGLLFQLF